MEKSCSITKGQMLAGARVGTISLVLGRHHVAKQRKDGAKRSLPEKRITKEVQEPGRTDTLSDQTWIHP